MTAGSDCPPSFFLANAAVSGRIIFCKNMGKCKKCTKIKHFLQLLKIHTIFVFCLITTADFFVIVTDKERFKRYGMRSETVVKIYDWGIAQ